MLSVVILTKNEELALPRALTSVAFADEVVVIDDDSSDKTVEIALAGGAKVHRHTLANDFARAREYGQHKAQEDWILHLDADEEVTEELAQDIKTHLKNAREQAFYIKRRDIFWEQEIKWGEVRTAYTRGFIRLHKKGAGHWHNAVHEEFVPPGWPGTLKGFINHYPHSTLTQFISKINMYSTMRARELFRGKKTTNVVEVIAYPLGKFFYTYVLLLGFLDGAAGFTYSFMMSFHSFLVRVKLYQYTRIDSQ